MEDLEIVCPVCGEASLVLAEDLEDLEVGDVLECEACGAFLEVVSLDPLEVEVTEEGLEGFFVDCPRCGRSLCNSIGARMCCSPGIAAGC